jgi:hypothetical protein
MEIAVPTELSSGAISSILESVPGIAHVLRSPVADAMVNLSRAAAGLAPFRPEDALELIRYAVRRGLIGSDEGDRVTAEISGAAQAKAAKAATRKAAREQHRREVGRERKPRRHRAHDAAPKRHAPARKAAKRPAAKPKPAARKSKSAAGSRRRRSCPPPQQHPSTRQPTCRLAPASRCRLTGG